MSTDRELYQHKEWLGLLQPVGLVVSPSALNKHQAEVNRYRAIELQPRLQGVVSTAAIPGRIQAETAWLEDFPAFAERVLEWLPEDLQTPPETLEHALPDYGETLRPTYAVADPDSQEWIMLVQTVKPGLPLDEIDPETATGQGWKATLQAKFERLLRETQIPIGLLSNGLDIRLVYAPRGESSGYLTFPVQAMTEVPGRLILTALEMLIGNDRLFNLPSDRRLPKILADSRNDQAEVSTKLASQVLDALWELLRGFQSADADVNGELLREAQTDTQHLYGGLIATLMRLVFLLYAEDEGLMPDDAIYQRNYAVSGLYQQLREDAGLYPDTMDQRYGAWASLLSLFRLVYDGGGTTQEYLPARHGQLFDPDEFPFLEGRPRNSCFQTYDKINVPRIPDGVIFRILDKLLILDAERLSYRALDVEQIGSVYEAIMGYEVEVAEGVSIAVKPKDIVIDVEALLKTKSKDRAKFLQNQAECKLTGKGLTELKAAKTPEEIVAALDRKVSARTPNLLSKGCLYLQPGEERRRTGSHYTPRKLTQPLVETTLRPVLEALGEHPTAESILALKVCDLAMGSAAFLVEACRQLAEKLVAAWDYHGLPDDFNRPPVEPLLLARRLVAQRCLYGVDKNPFAVNLAKLSLWLVTLSKDMPFTFVDHALKCGDSLVGLTQQEIGGFGKDPIADLPLIQLIQEKLDRAKSWRSQIQEVDTRSNTDAEKKLTQLQNADRELDDLRLVGDVAIAAFFDGVGMSKKAATDLQLSYQSAVRQWRAENYQPDGDFYPKLTSISNSLRFPNFQASPHELKRSHIGLPPALLSKGGSRGDQGGQAGDSKSDLDGKYLGGNCREKSITPFNWEIEFPEVFDRENPGFDAIIGNPPFLGGKKISTNFGDAYKEWLTVVNPESNSNSDIVAHFFRRAFTIVRKQGTFGLIATNTIAQGDTRSSGLRFICNNGGTIYNAQKRVKWPGLAAVVVSTVNIIKGDYSQPKNLDGRMSDKITAFLFYKGGNEDPKVLLANANKSFIGSIVLGMGFTFDDTNPDATSIDEMHRLIEKDPRNAERIFPYIGGQEVNQSPTHSHHRYVINFGEMSEDEARQWPDLIEIVEEKVKPDRLKKSKEIKVYPWWKFWRTRQELYDVIAKLDRVLVISRVGQQGSFTFLPAGMVYSEQLVIFPLSQYPDFCILQSRIHEIWVRFFGSSMKDDLRYTPTNCFETYPFPEKWETDPNLETIGKEYYEYRAELMVSKNEGLTDTYNRFHNPEETDPDIIKLRQLHQEIDKAVLKAYGWEDIDISCGFALDYLDLDEDSNLDPEAKDRIATGDYYFPTAEEASNFDSLIRQGKKRKLPWRYRWSEATHDEILARLLDLNQKRYEEEVLGGKKSQKKTKTQTKSKQKRVKSKQNPPTIPGLEL